MPLISLFFFVVIVYEVYASFFRNYVAGKFFPCPRVVAEEGEGNSKTCSIQYESTLKQLAELISGEPEWGKGYIRDFFKEFLDHCSLGCRIAWGGKEHRVLPKMIDLDGLKKNPKGAGKGGVILAWVEGRSVINNRNWGGLLLVGDKGEKERPVLNYFPR